MFCLFVLTLRGIKTRTYHWTLLLELACMALWVPPVYAIAHDIVQSPDQVLAKSTTATLAFCGINIFFRLMNAVGNTLLLLDFKFWRHNRPYLSLPGRAAYTMAAVFVFWTYPQSLDQEYPGRYRWRFC